MIDSRDDRLSEPLLSLGEVAALLGISVAAARRIPAGELPFSRITARNDRRYERADVVRYVDSRKVDQ